MKSNSSVAFFVAFLWALWPLHSSSELIVNVSRNKTNQFDTSHHIKITGETSSDSVTIEFNEADGSLVTSLTDFRRNVQITRLIIAGEEELNEPRAQTLCFVTRFNNDLISPEAVMKLRQKNPGAIRSADEDLGDFYQNSAVKLNPRTYSFISSHLPKLCRGDAFISKSDLSLILEGNNEHIQTVIQDESIFDLLNRCYTLTFEDHKPCQCFRQVCLHWIPTALKYCKNKEDSSEHRCGIKTSKKCINFQYRSKSKWHCLWDEESLL